MTTLYIAGSTSSGSGLVSVDGSTGTVSDVLVLPTSYQFPAPIGFLPDATTLYVAMHNSSWSETYLVPIDTTTWSVGTGMMVPFYASYFCLSPDGNWIATSDGSQSPPSFSLINLQTAQTYTVTLTNTQPGDAPGGVCFRSDSSTLFCVKNAGSAVAPGFLHATVSEIVGGLTSLDANGSSLVALDIGDQLQLPSVYPGPNGLLWFGYSNTSGIFVRSLDTGSLTLSTPVTTSGPTYADYIGFASDGSFYYTDRQQYVGFYNPSTGVSSNGAFYFYYSGLGANHAARFYYSAVDDDGSTLYVVDEEDYSLVAIDGANIASGASAAKMRITLPLTSTNGLVPSVPLKFGVWSIGGLALSA